MARDTTSGKYYEDTVELAIKRSCVKNNLVATKQVAIGTSPTGGKHKVDWELVKENDEKIRGLISCKFQDTGGTAEEKITYEVVKLLHAMKLDPRIKRAWITLGGDGWNDGLKKFYETQLEEFIPEMAGRVFIISSTDKLLSTNLSLD